MLHPTTLSEIATNKNTGVEYEIALFYKLLVHNSAEQQKVFQSFCCRADADAVKDIVSKTDITSIETALKDNDYTLEDVSFETQNDNIGPADIILYVSDKNGTRKQLGLSVKYANTCTLNVTGRKFITDEQIASLRSLLPKYTKMYIKEMTEAYGNVDNWFRKRKPSNITEQFIDLIRDAVITNWKNICDKATLLSALFHKDSPIDFWVVTYERKGLTLKTNPQTIDESRADDIVVRKYQTSYVAFYLDGKMVGHMQVKFNNGFVEKCKKNTADELCQGVRMTYGQPFSSWNFSVEK